VDVLITPQMPRPAVIFAESGNFDPIGRRIRGAPFAASTDYVDAAIIALTRANLASIRLPTDSGEKCFWI
jgi:hypothetical protein